MTAALPKLDELPRQNATQVKNRWGEVVRLVRQTGSVAITNHSTVEMVLLPAATYERVAQQLEALQSQQASRLDELSARFEARLAGLQQPEAPAQVEALFAARGRLGAHGPARRPKAGSSF